jgi:hypothetical protein
MRPAIAGVLAALMLTPAAAGEAVAAPSSASALTAWIVGIDASPDWNAGFLTLTTAADTNTAVISGLSFRAEQGGLIVTLDKVTITGYAVDPAGRFSATSVKVDGGTAEFGSIKVGLTDLDLTGIVIPALNDLTYDPSKPFTSQLKAIAAVSKMTLTHGSVGTLSLIQQFEGISSRTAYENLTIDGLSGGKIGAVQAGPLTMQAPATEGLAGIRIKSAETRDIDLSAFLHVYDPAAYAGGAGDLAWRQAIGHAGYQDFVMEIPGIRISVGEVGFDKFSLRQPKASFTDYLDRRMTRPETDSIGHDPGDEAALASLISAFGVGRFSVDHLAIEAIGIDKLGFAGFHIAGLSSDAIAELGIDGFEAGIEGAGTVKVGHFALSDAKLPGAEALIGAVRTAESGGNVDVSALAPTFGHVEAADLFLDAPDFPQVALGRLRADFGSYVGRVPTTVTTEVSGIDIPTRLLPNRMVAGLLATFGYDRVTADAGFKLGWSEGSETATVDNLRFAMKGMGTLTGSAVLSGLSRQMLDESGSILAALPAAMLAGGTFTFKDESLVEKGLAYRAKAAKADPEKLRKQLATALPFMLGFLGNPDFQKQVGPVLKAFLLAPGTITAKLAPPAPVALSEISGLVRSAPETLPDRLGVAITGVPATPPSPEASKPEPAAALSPAPAESGKAPAPEMRRAIDP